MFGQYPTRIRFDFLQSPSVTSLCSSSSYYYYYYCCCFFSFSFSPPLPPIHLLSLSFFFSSSSSHFLLLTPPLVLSCFSLVPPPSSSLSFYSFFLLFLLLLCLSSSPATLLLQVLLFPPLLLLLFLSPAILDYQVLAECVAAFLFSCWSKCEFVGRAQSSWPSTPWKKAKLAYCGGYNFLYQTPQPFICPLHYCCWHWWRSIHFACGVVPASRQQRR